MSHTVSKFCLTPKTTTTGSSTGIWRYLVKNSKTLWSGGNSALSRFSWRNLWTGVKCNVSSAHHHDQTSLESSWLAEFECEISPGYDVRQKKLLLSIIPARRLSDQPGLGTPQKVWTTTFLHRNWTSRTLLESSRSQTLKYAVSAWLAKR